MSARAASPTQAVPLPLALQVLVLLAFSAVPLALAAVGGGVAARWALPSARPRFSDLSELPLTSSALVAELDPSLAAPVKPLAPAPAASPPAAAPATDAPAAAPTASPAPQPGAVFSPGESAFIAGIESGCVNVRSTPGLSGHVLQCLNSGTGLHILAGPTDADGYRWWSVDAGGWVAESFLTAPAAPAGTASPAPSAAAGASSALAPAQRTVGGYAGWATYYGVEDGFVRGDVMYDGTPFDPANPMIAAGSFLIPLHTWLLVCSTSRCIVVQVRDRGLLDQNGVLLDLSRAAYASLFGGLGGKQHITALFIDPGIVALFPSLAAAATP